MIKFDVNLGIDGNGGRITVEHNINNQDHFAHELANAIDMVIADIIPSNKNDSKEVNIKRAEGFRNELLEKIKKIDFTCPERYTENDLILYK